MKNPIRYHATGKAIYGTYDEDCPAMHYGDMKDEVTAATVVKHLNDALAPDFNYMDECDKTCSVEFRPHNVELDDIRSITKKVISYAEDMNLIKKLLFRGKTRAELGFGEASKPTVGNLVEGFVGENQWAPRDIDILHGAIGVITEAGEVAEYLLEWINGKPFDKVNVMEEAGDLRWYIVRSLRGIGITDEMNERANIDKLRGRLGDNFDIFRDAHRDLAKERGKLEDNFKTAAPAPLFEGDHGVIKNPQIDGIEGLPNEIVVPGDEERVKEYMKIHDGGEDRSSEDFELMSGLIANDPGAGRDVLVKRFRDAYDDGSNKYNREDYMTRLFEEAASAYDAKVKRTLDANRPRKSGDVSDMAHRIKEATKADTVAPVPPGGVRSGPIGDCEGMDC